MAVVPSTLFQVSGLKKMFWNYNFIVEKQYSDASVIMRISAAHKYLSVLLIPPPP